MHDQVALTIYPKVVGSPIVDAVGLNGLVYDRAQCQVLSWLLGKANSLIKICKKTNPVINERHSLHI